MSDEHDPSSSCWRVQARPRPRCRRPLGNGRSPLPQQPCPRGTRPRSMVLVDYAPPRSLVPSLLISAAAAFVVDAFIKVARLFTIS